jgi:hypothetical protein
MLGFLLKSPSSLDSDESLIVFSSGVFPFLEKIPTGKSVKQEL